MMDAHASADWIERALAQRPEQHELEVEGARVEARTWGSRGDPGLLLIHGAGAHAGWWDFIAPFFSAHRRVAAFSLSGMGGSDWRERYSLDLFAREAFAVAEAAGLFAAGPPVVVGHSFGGRVALSAAAAEAGSRLAAVVAVDTLILPPDTAMNVLPFSRRNTRTYPDQESIVARFRLVPAQPPGDASLMRHIAQASVRETEEGWRWRFDPELWDKLADHPSIEDLKRARCPVAAIRGERSLLMPPEVTGYFEANAPAGTPVVVVPEAHHHLMLDQPLAFVAALRGLLAGWPSGGPA